jgi:hypothetical protein
MRVAEKDVRQIIRRRASQAMLVYDSKTKLPLGQVLDMSGRGMKLLNESPIKTNRIYYCRMPLERKIKGREEVFFDAECRWCRYDEATTWYHCGFLLRYPSKTDAAIVQELIRVWMIDGVESINKHNRPVEKEEKSLLKRLLDFRKNE